MSASALIGVASATEHPDIRSTPSVVSRRDKEWMRGIGAQVDDEHDVLSIYAQELIDIDFKGDIDIDATRSRWEEEQACIAAAVSEVDAVSFNDIQFYAGADISFHKDDPDKAIACMVIFERLTHRIIAEVSCICRTNIPYIPGFLAYREAPILIAVLDLIKTNCPEFTPELIVCDGNGIWHPRWCGVASHLSVVTGIPCIGVAKKILGVSTLTREAVLSAMSPEKGSMIDFSTDGRVIGTGFNSTGSINSAMYISIGSGISLETTKAFIREVTKHKVVEPVRCADLVSRRILATL